MMRMWIVLVLGLMMGLLTACGADKPTAPSAPKTVAPPKAVITPPAVKPVATKPPAAKPPAYVIPASLFSGEVKRVYPRGKRRKAKKLNRSGLKARRKEIQSRRLLFIRNPSQHRPAL